MKKQYTNKQIEKSINHWANYLLENEMASAEEDKDILGEGWIRRIGHGIKNAVKKTKEIAHEINWLPQKMWDKVFKSNDGVKMMLDTMDRIIKNGKNALENVNIFASVPGKVYPIVGFSLIKHKTVLLLFVDRENTSAKPKTLGDLRKFLNDADVNIAAAIDSIRIAEAPASLSESIILEANVVDKMIDKNGWTKKQSLKPENLKLLKKAFKQNEKKTIEKIEKHFANKPASKPSSNTSTKTSHAEPKTGSTTKATSTKTTTSKSSKAHDDFESSTSATEPSTTEPTTSEPSADFEDSKATTKDPGDAIKVFDNELLKVVPDKKTGDKNIGFVFTKSKAEIAIDKKLADKFSH